MGRGALFSWVWWKNEIEMGDILSICFFCIILWQNENFNRKNYAYETMLRFLFGIALRAVGWCRTAHRPGHMSRQDMEPHLGTATNYLMSGYANRFHFYGASVGYEATNSWLRSPQFVVKKGCTYTIRFSYRTDGTLPNIPLTYWFNSIDPTLKGTDATALAKVKTDCGEINITKKVTAYTETMLECVAESDGMAYLSLRVYSDGMSDELAGRVYMAGFSVSEAGGAAAAAAPSDVKAVAAEGGELTVDVSWTLPTVDADGQPLDGDRAVESVAVYRDGALAATLAADATSWRDTAEAGLTPGKHTYEVGGCRVRLRRAVRLCPHGDAFVGMENIYNFKCRFRVFYRAKTCRIC